MTEIAEGQEVLRSTIVDPQSTSGEVSHKGFRDDHRHTV